MESEDGRFVYYRKINQPGIWRVPLNGGEEQRVCDQPVGGPRVLSRDGLQFHKRDYRQPPEEFEKTRQGDCDCLWRIACMGAVRKGGRHFRVDPTMARPRNTMPRLSTLRYSIATT